MTVLDFFLSRITHWSGSFKAIGWLKNYHAQVRAHDRRRLHMKKKCEIHDVRLRHNVEQIGRFDFFYCHNKSRRFTWEGSSPSISCYDQDIHVCVQQCVGILLYVSLSLYVSVAVLPVSLTMPVCIALSPSVCSMQCPFCRLSKPTSMSHSISFC